MNVERVDALVIGGGPGGSTVGAILGAAGKRVVVLEPATFPRFHIGESLLPGNMRLFERLGVTEEVSRCGVKKPGAFFALRNGVRMGNAFSFHDGTASFKDTPYCFNVERSLFDAVLLENAGKKGAEVRFGHRASKLVWNNGHLEGALIKRQDGADYQIKAAQTFDCSGQNALIATSLKLKRPTTLKRMSVYAHYQVAILDKALRQGYFLAQVVDDGWIWLIVLGRDRVSIGVVTAAEKFVEAESSPTEYLERMATSTELLRTVLGAKRERIGETSAKSNLGYTCDHLTGSGWALVGDAAFFIDPLFSNGVLLAMVSGERAADAFLEACESPGKQAEVWRAYQTDLKSHEKQVTLLVEHFYYSSRSKTLQGVHAVLNEIPWVIRRLMTFAGGDFWKHGRLIKTAHTFMERTHRVLP